MRRAERQVTDMSEIKTILDSNRICYLALLDRDGWPYTVPLNYGYVMEADGALTLWFHGAKEGKKMELLAADARGSFVIGGENAVISGGDVPCAYSAAYASVAGRGRIERVADPDKMREGLQAIMLRVSGRADFTYSDAALEHVAVLQLRVETYTAKCNKG